MTWIIILLAMILIVLIMILVTTCNNLTEQNDRAKLIHNELIGLNQSVYKILENSEEVNAKISEIESQLESMADK